MAIIVCQSDQATLTLDVVTDRSIDFQNEVTKYPVEAGFDVSNHVVQGQPSLKLTGAVTNMTGGPFGGRVGGGGAGQLAQQLETVLRQPANYTVRIGSKVMTDMAIDSCQIKESSGSDGGSVIVDLTFVHIRVVSTRRTKAPPKMVADKAKGKTGQSNKNVGANNTGDASKEDSGSLVHSLVSAAKKAIDEYFGSGASK